MAGEFTPRTDAPHSHIVLCWGGNHRGRDRWEQGGKGYHLAFHYVPVINNNKAGGSIIICCR